MEMRKHRWAMIAVVLLSPAAAAYDKPDNVLVTRAGDALQVGVPLAALGLTFLLGDDAAGGGSPDWSGVAGVPGFEWTRMNGSPRHDLALAMARTELVTYGLKYGVDAERPSGGGQSFPSGHTSVAFAGAEFIRKQYGWEWGIPAYLAAGFVGWSRVESANHWPRDVWAGAAIGILSNYDATGLQMPFGLLTVAPALLGPVSAGADAAAAGAPDPDGFSIAPGLRIEFKF